MKKWLVLCMALVLALRVHAAKPQAAEFYRGIVYYLIDDLAQAKKYLDNYFRFNPQPSIHIGFMLLLDKENWEATKKFSDHLDSDYRSLEALIGISLAVADMRNSTTLENLTKALRVNPACAEAYLCLGNEYLKRRNYPLAEQALSRSVKLSRLPEGKIMLTRLYLQSLQPGKAFATITPEADNQAANFYYNFLAASAGFQLSKLPETRKYMERALAVNPDSKDTLLLKAQWLARTGELKKAKALLENLKFDYYHPDYSITFAEVLFQLHDREADKYLYEAFSQNKWHPGLNRLLALNSLKKGNGATQNWINRALLSGASRPELQKEFPSSIHYPQFAFLPFFDIKKVSWLAGNQILVAGKKVSGDQEDLLIVGLNPLAVLKDFKYKGSIQDVFVSPSLTKAFISTTAVENEKVYLYTLRVSVRNAVLTPVADYPLKMAAVQAAFGQEEQAVYFTDSSAADLFFESPFSFSGAYGQKFSVYPRFPFPVFGYNFSSDRLLEIKNSQVLRLLSIPDLQRYLLVADAYNRDAEVSQLIQRGQKLDITSSTYVKIVFPASPSHFIIFFSDSKNAFQALLYVGASNKTVRLDETMFLGENRYAELQIIHFDPAKKEILFLTKDKERELIFFNYSSLLYRKLGSGVLGVFLDEAKERVLALSERNRLPYYSETNLEVVALNPYAKQKINSRHDLIDVFAGPGNDSFLFATYNGEIVSMNEEYSLKSVGLSFADVPHAESPDGKTVAAFINGRLFVLNRDL